MERLGGVRSPQGLSSEISPEFWMQLIFWIFSGWVGGPSRKITVLQFRVVFFRIFRDFFYQVYIGDPSMPSRVMKPSYPEAFAKTEVSTEEFEHLGP